MKVLNYEQMRLEQIGSIADKSQNKLLLHSCCAPCSSACIERLIDFFDVTVFYYNPNIDEAEEYFKRADEQARFLKERYGERVKLVVCDHQPQVFFETISGCEQLGEGSARCYKCYKLRIDKSVEFAKENNFNFVGTTLSVSPYKNAQWLNTLGVQACENQSIQWLFADFKKQNGYARSVELSNQYGLYRQDYCGCRFSRQESIDRRNAIKKDI